jgi:hypothetical protein
MSVTVSTIKHFINLSNSETSNAVLEPIKDSDLTFESLHQEIGKPIQENLPRSENLTVM